MKTNAMRSMACVACAALLCGCATDDDSGSLIGAGMGTVGGAGMGAGTGAIIGSATGNAGVGTAIGAGLGAPVGMAIGYGIGKAFDAERKADRAMQEAQAASAGGATPATPAAGGTRVVRAQPVSDMDLFTCSSCQVTLDISGYKPGDRVRCPDCNTALTIP